MSKLWFLLLIPTTGIFLFFGHEVLTQSDSFLREIALVFALKWLLISIVLLVWIIAGRRALEDNRNG